jgi:hypothetical protein
MSDDSKLTGMEKLMKEMLRPATTSKVGNLNLEPDALTEAPYAGDDAGGRAALQLMQLLRSTPGFVHNVNSKKALLYLASQIDDKSLDDNSAKLMSLKSERDAAESKVEEAIAELIKVDDERTETYKEYKVALAMRMSLSNPATSEERTSYREVNDRVNILKEKLDASDADEKAHAKLSIARKNATATQRKFEEFRMTQVNDGNIKERELFRMLSPGVELGNMKIPKDDADQLRGALNKYKYTVDAASNESLTLGNPVVGSSYGQLSKSDEGKFIQAIIDTRELQRQAGPPPHLAIDVDRLLSNKALDASITVMEDSPLFIEIELLNAMTAAGYDPYRLTKVFGVPISGVAKRLLDVWSMDKRPLTYDKMRKIFSIGESYRQNLNLDSTSVSTLLTEIEKQRRPIKVTTELSGDKSANKGADSKPMIKVLKTTYAEDDSTDEDEA